MEIHAESEIFEALYKASLKGFSMVDEKEYNEHRQGKWIRGEVVYV